MSDQVDQFRLAKLESDLARLLCASIDGPEYVDSMYARGEPQLGPYGFFVPTGAIRPFWQEYLPAARAILERYDLTPKS